MILRNHLKNVGYLLTSYRRSKKDIQALQFDQLQKVVLHAYYNVRFYHDYYKSHNFHPSQLRTIQDLCRIPMISKSDLVLLEPAAITARNIESKSLIMHSTSATSGVPTTVYRTWTEERLLNAFRWRNLFEYGLRPGHTVAVIMPLIHRSSFFYKLITRAAFINIHVIDALKEPEKILAKLFKLKPDIIKGAPGVLERVSGCMNEVHKKFIHPRFVITGAETLTDEGRASIENAFGARVFDVYSSFEFNRIAMECKETGEMHTCDDNMIVEIIKNDNPAAYGETGELVGTSLHSFAMPFIRYRLGDLVIKGREQCRCGIPFGTINKIEGRVTDYFTLPDGRKLHPYQLLISIYLKLYPFIRQYQVIQESLYQVTLRLVLKDINRCPDINSITQKGQSILGPGVKFTVHVTDEIPLTKRGKILTYQSLVKE